MSERHDSQATRKLTIGDKNRLLVPIWGASDGIRGPVEVVWGIDWALHLLPGTVEHPLACVEPDEVLVQLVLIIKVLRKAIAVAKRTVDDTARPPVGRLQVVTV
jgi:hypothetical protein